MTSLSEYIRQHGSDAAVSAKVGLDRTTVSRIRRGIADPPLSTVQRIVSALGGRVVIEQPALAPEPARATA